MRTACTPDQKRCEIPLLPRDVLQGLALHRRTTRKNQNSLDKSLQAENNNEPELQTCFDLLYGVMMLRLQKKHISDDTAHAVKDISTLLGQLSDYYFKDKKEPLDFND